MSQPKYRSKWVQLRVAVGMPFGHPGHTSDLNPSKESFAAAICGHWKAGEPTTGAHTSEMGNRQGKKPAQNDKLKKMKSDQNERNDQKNGNLG